MVHVPEVPIPSHPIHPITSPPPFWLWGKGQGRMGLEPAFIRADMNRQEKNSSRHVMSNHKHTRLVPPSLSLAQGQTGSSLAHPGIPTLSTTYPPLHPPVAARTLHPACWDRRGVHPDGGVVWDGRWSRCRRGRWVCAMLCVISGKEKKGTDGMGCWPGGCWLDSPPFSPLGACLWIDDEWE